MIKNGLAVSKSQLIVEKLIHFIIIWCCFLLKIRISIIATSCSIYAIFSFLGSGFWALEYRSTHCASTPLSYSVHNMATNVQTKAFAGTRGGTMFYKTFLISI